MGVVLHGVSREYDGFFKIDKLDIEHERYDGGTHRRPWLVFERGNAAAVVLYRRDTQQIVLVRQFRAPTLHISRSGGGYTLHNDGQLDETIAGMPREGETLRKCAVREVYEETRYRLKEQQLELIAQFYASPGGTSERIYLYYAEVTADHLEPAPKDTPNVAGVAKDAESILVRHVPVSTFFAQMIDPDVAIDSKVLIASMLLRERLRGHIPDAATQAAPPGRYIYNFPGKSGCTVVLRTGDMMAIKDVDAWVNSENTDMEMDRFIGTSVSARIRYAGAAKDDQDRVIEDTIADALRKRMRGRFTSNIGTVHDTTSGDLFRSNNVKRLFHVAVVRGVATKGIHAVVADIEPVTRKALSAIENRNQRWGTTNCSSALLPMFCTGDGKVTIEVAFPEILKGILQYFAATRSPYLAHVHLSVYRQHDADYVKSVLDAHPDLVPQI